MCVQMKDKPWPRAHFAKCQLLQTVNRTYGRGAVSLPTPTCLKTSSPDCVLPKKQPALVWNEFLSPKRNWITSAGQTRDAPSEVAGTGVCAMWGASAGYRQTDGPGGGGVGWSCWYEWWGSASHGCSGLERCFSSAAVPWLHVLSFLKRLHFFLCWMRAQTANSNNCRIILNVQGPPAEKTGSDINVCAGPDWFMQAGF